MQQTEATAKRHFWLDDGPVSKSGPRTRTQREVKPMAKISEVPAPVEETVGKTIEATVTSLKAGVAKATANFEATQAQVKQGVEKAVSTAEELVSFNQANLEAIVKAGQIWAAGIQDLSKHLAATAQAALDESIATFKALSGAKSLKDAVDLQTAYARATLEKTLAESGKLTDASIKLTEQALAPITARVTVAVEKFSKAS
nr:phasin family protein [uncultured Rhodopila sp.]